MTKKFDNFLLGLLWLLTVTLAATFWMNIKYGFNIFSAAHWAYLSELQAYRTQIKLDFYISLIGAIVIGLTGLYLLARPRRQTFFIEPTKMPPRPDQSNPRVILPQPEEQKENIQTKLNQPTARPTPPRPASPTIMRTAPTPPRAPHTIPTPKTLTTTPAPHMFQIIDVFESTGYTVRKCVRIGKLVQPVVALSYNQTLWIAVEGVSTSDVMDAIQTLITIFDDTLGDSANDISLHACVLDATDDSTNPDLISTFKTLDELRKFMNEHPNTKPDDYDQDLFDAVSTYIDTVTNYIGKQ